MQYLLLLPKEVIYICIGTKQREKKVAQELEVSLNFRGNFVMHFDRDHGRETGIIEEHEGL